MSEDIIAILKQTLGNKSPLPIAEVSTVCRIIAEEGSISVLTSDKLFSFTRKLRQPVKVILSYDIGFEALLVLFSNLERRWLSVLGELLAHNKGNIVKCFNLARQFSSKEMIQPLFFVAHYMKRYHADFFAKEFTNQLNRSWNINGLLLILPLFNTEDTALLEPLRNYLDKLNSVDATPELRKDKRKAVAALKAAIRKIEGKPDKQWWHFWRQ